MYSQAKFNDREINHNYQPCFGNFSKECSENNKIYSRSKPLDDLPKQIILDPRPLTTSLCNLEEYNRQCYIFPPKTESIVTEYGDKLDETFCQQNFVNVDDESFLFNINKRYARINEANIATPIVPMNTGSMKQITNVYGQPEELLLDQYAFNDFINLKTKRRDLVE
jgi:hypothetical protein